MRNYSEKQTTSTIQSFFYIQTVRVDVAGTSSWALFFESDQTKNDVTRKLMRKKTPKATRLPGDCMGRERRRAERGGQGVPTKGVGEGWMEYLVYSLGFLHSLSFSE